MKLHHSGARANSATAPTHSRRRVDSIARLQWPEGGLCRAMDSAGFLIDGKWTDANTEAVRACWRCPILNRCDQGFDTLPAHHRMQRVAGGNAYNSRGAKYEPPQLRKARQQFEKEN